MYGLINIRSFTGLLSISISAIDDESIGLSICFSVRKFVSLKIIFLTLVKELNLLNMSVATSKLTYTIFTSSTTLESLN